MFETVSNFDHLILGFVSYFVLRILDLKILGVMMNRNDPGTPLGKKLKDSQ
jgi:hypothetical protein